MFLYSTGSTTLEETNSVDQSFFLTLNSPLAKKKFVEVKRPEVLLMCC